MDFTDDRRNSYQFPSIDALTIDGLSSQVNRMLIPDQRAFELLDRQSDKSKYFEVQLEAT